MRNAQPATAGILVLQGGVDVKQVFHLKVARAAQLNPSVVDMHARIAFRVDREALAEIFGEEVKWRELRS